VLAAYVLVIAICAFALLRSKRTLRNWWPAMIAIFIATGAMILISEAKTDGSWGWRWGNSVAPGTEGRTV
jgi:hypothetical protein